MAKIVYLCTRDPEESIDFKTRMDILNRWIIPDNITPNPPNILEVNGVHAGLLNPTSEMLTRGASVCAGFPIFTPSDWWKPGGGDPDGSYALFRSDDDCIELGTDIFATRTIWFCQTDRLFIASTSQRAIVALLGDFQVNNAVYPFMLSSGVLGPNHSWDRRINHLEADDHLTLNRRDWQVIRRHSNFMPQAGRKSRQEYKEDLRRSLKEVFEELHFDPRKWALTLSGGLDSRGILAFLKGRPGIHCVTWGTRSSAVNLKSDAAVARRVAASQGLDCQFYETDNPEVINGEEILSRFIEAGEGRVDQLGGYRDGFVIWKKLFESGLSGYIRGDEFMGLKHLAATEEGILPEMNFYLLSDFENLPPCAELGLPDQTVPEKYCRRDGETLFEWATRIRFNVKKVIEMAALNEIKTSYLEAMTPLISRRIADVIKEIPFSMNRNKSIFRELVEEIIPGIPYAEPSDQSIEEIIREPLFESVVRTELESEEARKWLPQKLIDILLENLREAEPARKGLNFQPVLQKIKKWIPGLTVLSRFYRRKKLIDGHLIAFRGYIIARSCAMFARDSELFRQIDQRP